jgi:hypothetical protein
MMGNPEIHDLKGLIPRSLEQIFQTSQCLISQGWKYKMQVRPFKFVYLSELMTRQGFYVCHPNASFLLVGFHVGNL